MATFLGINMSRGAKAISQMMPEGFNGKVLVTDCWASYFTDPTSLHQRCTAHLLRELNYFAQRYPTNNWSGRVQGLISNALDLRRNNQLSAVKIEEIKRSFALLLQEPVNNELKELVTFQKRLVKYSGYVFHFIENPEVPPDNYASERALRNFKIKLKVSGLFRSENGANIFAMLRSIIDTAIKQNQNPYNELQAIAMSAPTE